MAGWNDESAGSLPLRDDLMTLDMDILVPLRNPTAVLLDSIRSLSAQSERSFSVLISDNHSSKGSEFIEESAAILRDASIACQVLRPAMELGRVEHWNWLHYQSGADWLKPLFAGDWLEPVYTARVLELRKRHPECRYIYSSYHYHKKDEEKIVVPHWTGVLQDKQEMRQVVARHGMQFGPPSAACYHRELFYSQGSYNPMIPICADSHLFCQFAASAPSYGIKEALCHFNIHDNRFSTGLAEKALETRRETICYMVMLGSQAWFQGWKVSGRHWLRRAIRILMGT